jgi:hypothetical protein
MSQVGHQEIITALIGAAIFVVGLISALEARKGR